MEFYWIVCLIGIAGEFVVPAALRFFYPRYHIFRDGLGKLSNPKSPVQWFYRAWQILAGVSMILTGVGLGQTFGWFGIVLMVLLILYGVLGRILLAVLSVVDIYDVEWAPAVVYRIARLSGFFCLQFGVLFLSAFLFACGPLFQFPQMAGAVLLVCTLVGILCYALNRMSRRREFLGTVLQNQGFWELLCLLCLYAPLGVLAGWMLSLA